MSRQNKSRLPGCSVAVNAQHENGGYLLQITSDFVMKSKFEVICNRMPPVFVKYYKWLLLVMEKSLDADFMIKYEVICKR